MLCIQRKKQNALKTKITKLFSRQRTKVVNAIFRIAAEYILFYEFGLLHTIRLLEESENTHGTLEINQMKFTETFEVNFILLKKIENVTKVDISRMHAISILTRNTYIHQKEIEV